LEKACIGVLCPGSGFSGMVRQAARELGLTVTVREESQAAAALRDWEGQGRVEIVAVRGSMAADLRKQCSLPVVGVEAGGLDVAEALRRAGTSGLPTVLLDRERRPPRYDYGKITAVGGVDCTVRIYRSDAELNALLAALDGLTVVAAEDRAARQAAARGLTVIPVQVGLEAVREALMKASDICRVRRRDAHFCRFLHAVLNNAFDGIMAVERDEVTLFNHVAERITCLSAGEVLGRPVAAVCRANAACRALYGDGEPVSDSLVYLGELPLLVNRRSGQVGSESSATLVTFQAADRIRRMEAKLRQELHHQGLVAKFRFHDIVGKSAMLGETVREARKYARSEAAVLITGESGTGKELFAHSIHNESRRRDGPFVAVNCAALPESLLESELFGYEEGAFTGAKKGGKQGLFTLAHGGTIFLDEVGELGLGLQTRLLRVLQEKEVMPVGGQRICPVDVRVISSTNRDLEREVGEGRFRQDLFFRLNVLRLSIPPLRERLEDVPELFTFFLDRLAGPGSADKLNLTPAALEFLKRHLWPGNVRELQAFAARYAALGEDDTAGHSTFFTLLARLGPAGLREPARRASNGTLAVELGSLTDMERQILTQAWRLIKGNRQEMARILGISRTTLWKKLKELGVN